MASRIRVLTEHTINQIAAGEVIENPASVVKELVENAIDAGSTEICVEIKGGGRQLIRISDNGIGMNADDALLCLERHATSKIRDVEDIHAISTMGFRGEAIPSIASISKFTLISCPAESGKENLGTMVIVDGGKIIQCVPAARSQGTTVEVKSLFFNVPVRKKFQKSPAYDANEILKMLSTIALGHPQIKFQLINDSKTEFSTSLRLEESFQESLGRRVESILGKDFFESTCFVEAVNGDYVLRGFIGLPAFTRHNRTGQSLFINQRAISSPLVSFAVREGYGTTLSTNRHPVYVLHLTMPGSLVDVNVHPQKREVRLRQEQILKETVIRAIQNALQQGSQDGADQQYADFILPAPSNTLASSLSFSESSSTRLPWGELPYEPHFKMPPAPQIPLAISTPAFSPKIDHSPKIPFEMAFRPASPQREEFLFVADDVKSPPKVLCTLKQFILIDAATCGETLFKYPREGLCLVDQKAAHSRIIFEKLSLQLSGEHTLPVQTLLIPYSFDATPLESALLLENLDKLNALGISMRQLGTHTFFIDAIPQFFGNTDIHGLIAELIHSMREYQDSHAIKKIQEKQVAIAASRAAISYTQRISIEEAQALINQLMHCQMPAQCPLGKPTWIFIGHDELEKRFLRS
jgi:DNA mismatch repair protein MutL